MIVSINGEARELAARTVDELLAASGIDPSQQGIAVAVNDCVVRRTEWSATTIADGDAVEIITAMQGG